MYTYIERTPTETEYNKLRNLAGWGGLDIEKVRKSLLNSVFSVVAEYKNEIVGFARVVGDGGLCFYIQEIIVHPDHRRKGIATELKLPAASCRESPKSKELFFVIRLPR
jgi:ribosomal protein S18 acetylase RimI-like enzyme